jgi:hypothetical protein
VDRHSGVNQISENLMSQWIDLDMCWNYIYRTNLEGFVGTCGLLDIVIREAEGIDNSQT